MANHKKCKHYEVCDYRNAVGSCPDRCVQFKHRDAVIVIRCKDCKHYGWEQEPCHGRTQHFCKLHKGLVGVDRDAFCSYGEKTESKCENETKCTDCEVRRAENDLT